MRFFETNAESGMCFRFAFTAAVEEVPVAEEAAVGHRTRTRKSRFYSAEEQSASAKTTYGKQ
jgi:hypothetical protein